MLVRSLLAAAGLCILSHGALALDASSRGDIEAMAVKHAKANNVPFELVHRVIMRESRYNPRAVGRGGVFGLMQIKHGTARALGYAGSPQGLLDADTNLTYAVRYLAGAYRVAGGNHDRAVAYYARGYYYEAKRKGLRDVSVTASIPEPDPAPTPVRPFFGLFGPPAATPAPVVMAQTSPALEEVAEVVPSRRQQRRAAHAPLPPARP